jgi:hypothetical protein
MSTFIKINGNDYLDADYSKPADRTFRDAWDVSPSDKVISINMEAAKNVWRDKIRLARADAFIALDERYIRALETGANTASIVAQKQALRDAPALSSIDAATTPDELKAIQPISGVTIE